MKKNNSTVSDKFSTDDESSINEEHSDSSAATFLFESSSDCSIHDNNLNCQCKNYVADSSDEETNGSLTEESDDAEGDEWRIINMDHSDPGLYSEEEELVDEFFDTDDPCALFELFFNEEIINLIVKETNRYAESCEINNDSMVSSST